MTEFRNFLRLFALLLLAWLASGTAHAEGIATAAGIPIKTCVAPLADRQAAAALMVRPQAFDCSGNQSRYGQGDFLVQLRFAPVKPQTGDPLVLRTAAVWQDRASIQFHYADGGTARLDYSSRKVSRYVTIGSIFEFPVPQRDAALQTIYIEVHNAANIRGVVLSPSLMPLSESTRFKLLLTAAYSVFAGLVLALIVYNLSLWAALRHRFQLFYCGLLAALAAYMFSSSGALAMLVPSLDNNDRFRLTLLLLAIACISAMQFIRHFFEADVFGPRLRLLFNLTCAFALSMALVFAVLAPWNFLLLERFYIAAMSAMLCLLLPILANAWRTRSRYFWLFLLAWSLPILSGILRSAYGFDLIGYSLWLDNSNLIAMAAEALLSSLMVTSRVRELSLERDDAVAGEQVALRLANTDPLTGLLNRRAFLDLAIGRRARHRLMLIDIDHFKKVNDRLGHDVGDQVICAVAQAIQQCRPARSLAVRLGGEEFAVLLPRSAFESCTADVILKAVRNHRMPQAEWVTVSIGYADGKVASEEEWKRLYRFADSALYRAKSDGRDRACRATDFSVAA